MIISIYIIVDIYIYILLIAVDLNDIWDPKSTIFTGIQWLGCRIAGRRQYAGPRGRCRRGRDVTCAVQSMTCLMLVSTLWLFNIAMV